MSALAASVVCVWSAANGQQMNGKETTDGQEGRKREEDGGRTTENPYPLDYSVCGIWTVVWLRRACVCVKSICLCLRDTPGVKLCSVLSH